MLSFRHAGLAVVGVALLTAVVAPLAGGQSDPPPAPRLAVVNLGRVFKNYKKSAELEARINAERVRLKGGLDVQRDLIASLNAELELYKIGSEEFDEKEEEKKIELARYQLLKERIQRKIKQRWEQYNLELLEDIEKVVEEYAKDSFTLVLKVEGTPLDQENKLMQAGLKNVLYFHPSVDITDNIVSLLNRKFAIGESGEDR